MTEKADSFSFGMLCYELMSRELPYHGLSPAEVSVGVVTNMLPRPELNESISQRCHSIPWPRNFGSP